MSDSGPMNDYSQDEIDLGDLFRAIASGKYLILAVTAIFALIAIVVLLMLPNIYRAEALLAPNQSDNGSGLSSLAAQYGGLASLAGLSLPANSADPTAVGLEILKSRKFISEFVARHEILVPLMAGEGWSADSRRLELDSSIYDDKQNEWVRTVSPPRSVVPSLQEAYEEFEKRLAVHQDSKSGLVTIAFDFYSPDIAMQWVEWLVADINDTVMRRDVAEAEQAIAYLNQQIEATSLAELHSVFYRLIEEKMKTVMLAKVSDEYLLKTIDPAVSPERKIKPRRAFSTIMAMLIGMIVGVLVVLVRRSATTPKAA